LSDTSTLTIIVGSSWADGYVSTDISTWSLLSLKDGSFDEKALLGMNGGSSGSSGSGSGGGSGNNSSSGYVLTMGEYSIMGNTYYGYIGPSFINFYTNVIWVNVITITPGSLIDNTVNGYVIDLMVPAWWWIIGFSGSHTDLQPLNIDLVESSASMTCFSPLNSNLDGVTFYSWCTNNLVLNNMWVGVSASSWYIF
jgi:hypothetical protein